MRIRPRPWIWFVAVAIVVAACSSSGGGSGGEQSADDPDDRSSELDALFDQYAEESASVELAASDAAEPADIPASAGGAAGFSRYVFREFEGQVLTSLVEGPLGRQVRCLEVDLPCSYEELKELDDSGAPVPDELGLTEAELSELVDQLDEVRATTERYADVNEACADGYISDQTQTPNMGSHFFSAERLADREFNPSEPEILIYTQADGESPDPDTYGQCVDGEWTGGDVTITAASFILPTSHVGDDHPDAFAGDLDNWHVHYNLCRGSGSDSIVTEEECRERGGNWQGRLGWMIHTWAAPGFDNQLGVFGMWNPTIWPVTDPGVLVGRSVVSPSDLPEGSALQPIRNFAFGEVTVDAGSEVVWSNSDSVAHTVNAGSQASPLTAFTSGVFAPGESYSVTFDEPGEYRYFCSLHPDMSGTVIVN